MQNVLLTGATGRVGRRLAAPLVAAGHAVTALVRSRGGNDPIARMERVGIHGVTAIEGELGGRMRGLTAGSWETIVHAALDGSSFPRDPRAQRRLNVDATLDLIETVRPRRLVLISTVRVAGARRGRALESELDVGQPFHNAGEECMLEAEGAARAAARRCGVELVVVRLGLVDGPGSDGSVDAMTAFSGLVASEAWNPRHWRSQLRVPGLKAAPMALSPAGWIGNAIAAMATAPAAANRCFHLVAPPPSQEAFFAAVAELADFPGLRVQTPRRGALRNPTRLEARAHAALGTQLEYFGGDLEFDRAGAAALLSELRVETPDLGGAALRPYVARLIAT